MGSVIKQKAFSPWYTSTKLPKLCLARRKHLGREWVGHMIKILQDTKPKVGHVLLLRKFVVVPKPAS